MSEIPELLASVREQEARRTPRGSRIALAVAGIGVVAAIAATATLAVSATASIAAMGLGGAGSEPGPAQVADVVADSAGAAPLDYVAAPAAPAAPEATAAPAADAGPPIYDASTDIATIPRPPADWPGALANAEVWLEQQGIIADCMLEQGYEYHFTPWYLYAPGEMPRISSSENWDGDMNSPKAVALWGAPDRGLGEDYDWREAGCDGYAVHVTGMEDAN